MELTKRSNFKLDLTDAATTSVTIKSGLKAIDFIGVIATVDDEETGRTITAITLANEGLDGSITFVIGANSFTYDPTTGEITLNESEPGSGDNGQT